MKIGVFLARFQPFHKSHQQIILKALEENQQVHVFIGSADKMREERNPFTADERMEFLESVLDNYVKDGALMVHLLPDYSTEDDVDNDKNWGNYLYENITKAISQDSFSLYYSDEPSIMLRWFTDDLKEKINFVFLDRKDLLEGLSATKIRKALREDDEEYLKKCLPKEIYDRKEELSKILCFIENDS